MAEGIKTRRGESKGILVTYLYNEGDECTALTGGWYRGFVYGTYYTFAKELAAILLGTTAQYSRVTARPTSAIDFTSYSKLKFLVNSQNSQNAALHIFVSATNNDSKPAWDLAWVARTSKESGWVAGDNTIEVDISAVTGSYYVYALHDGRSGVTAQLRIKSVLLEQE